MIINNENNFKRGLDKFIVCIIYNIGSKYLLQANNPVEMRHLCLLKLGRWLSERNKMWAKMDPWEDISGLFFHEVLAPSHEPQK